MRKIIVLSNVFSLLLFSIAFAYPQTPDLLRYNGDVVEFMNAPLLPKELPKGIALIKDEKLRTEIIKGTLSDKKYAIEYEIKDRKVFVNSIYGIYEKITEKPVFAYWISGSFYAEDLSSNKNLNGLYNKNQSNFKDVGMRIVIDNGIVIKRSKNDFRNYDFGSKKQSAKNVYGVEFKFGIISEVNNRGGFNNGQ